MTPEQMFSNTRSGDMRGAKRVLDAFLGRDGNVPAQIIHMLVGAEEDLAALEKHYGEWFKSRGKQAPQSYSGEAYE